MKSPTQKEKETYYENHDPRVKWASKCDPTDNGPTFLKVDSTCKWSRHLFYVFWTK